VEYIYNNRTYQMCTKHLIVWLF